MSDSQRNEQGSIESLSKFRSTVRELVGEEVKVMSEDVTRADGQEIYVRRVKYEKSAELFDLKWAITSQGQTIRHARR